MKRLYFLIAIMFLGLYPKGVEAQIFKSKKSQVESPTKNKDKGSKIKPFHEIITEDAVTRIGLINTHIVDDNYYFEIGDSLLEKEILVVSRISGFVKNLNFGGAGTKSRPQQVVRFQKKGKQILMREVSYNSVASEEEPIYESVKNNNFEPIIAVFDIKAFGKESNSSVIDVKELFTTNVPMFGAMYYSQEKRFGVRGVDKSRSYIESMKSFPQNVEVRHVLTYIGQEKLPDNKLTGTLSVELNQSFVLLPEIPLKTRYYDARVGYFSIRQTDYSSEYQKAHTKRYITRWRLEPKDPEAYFRGELVEPIKPIVYYIDPATPDEWKPYLKQGIDDWNVAFEQAGFKNAIIGKYAPTKEEDPDWTPEDVRYSTIRYVSTDIQNAMGPHVHDPRTGEILESDIIWYHNVMNLLRNWYFVQTAAVNPKARSVTFENAVMGQLIRFVAAHEVGHTLGLPHNMGSSSAYPVDSLRSPSFTKVNGTAPSIMDYARFNYIAQPEDGDVALMPKIGIYDKWSIEYGYRLLPNNQSPEEEKKVLNQWITDKKGDPLYRFGRQRGLPLDPSAQTEDLGDNSIKASDLGIKNLRRIMPNLIKWTQEDGKDFRDLDEMYGKIIGQYNRYMGHVTANIGGVYEVFKSYDEEEPIYTHVEKEKQRAAINFINQKLFQTPTWIIDPTILSRIEDKGIIDRIGKIQQRTLYNILNVERQSRMIENEAINRNNAYALSTLYVDLNSGIFGDLKTNQDVYRRQLQRLYIDKLIELMKSSEPEVKNSDIAALVRSQLKSMEKAFSAVKGQDINASHFQDLEARIKQALENK